MRTTTLRWRPLLQKLSRCSFLALFLVCAKRSFAQTSPISVRDSVYHWQSQRQPGQDPVLEGEYAGLRKADYTPPINIKTWKAAEPLDRLARSLGDRAAFHAEYVLLVNSPGIIIQVRVRTATDSRISAAIVKLLSGSQTNVQSYLGNNKAVPSYVPCSITIANKQITAR